MKSKSPAVRRSSFKRFRLRHPLALLAAIAAPVATIMRPAVSIATNYTWDPAANGSGSGGSGTWDLSTSEWFDGTNDIVWPNTNASVAVFGGTGGTVSLGTTGIQANGLTFNVTGYTIDNGGNASNTLTLIGAAPTITITNAADSETISAILAGTAGFTKAGPGSLILSNTDTITGGLTVTDGVLQLAGGGDNRLPTSTTLVLGSGTTSGKLVLGSAAGVSNQTLTSLTTAGTGTANAVVGGSTIASTLTLNVGTAFTYAGKLGGTGTNENNLGLTKTGAATLTLSGVNTYSGLTTVSAGTLALTTTANGVTGKYLISGSTAVVTELADLSLGAAPSSYTADAITLNNGGTLQSAATVGTTVSVNRGITVGSGGGALVNPTSFEFRTQTRITGPGQLTLTDNGSQNIVIDNNTGTSGTSLNDYSGGTIINGTGTGGVIPVQGGAGTPNNPTSGPFGTGLVTFAGGNFRVSGSAVNFVLYNRLAFTGNLTILSGGTATTFAGDASLNGAVRTINDGSANAFTFSGVIGNSYDNNGIISSAGTASGVTKSGTGTLTLTGSNIYSGVTTISGGTLSIPTFANGGVASPLGQSSSASANLVFNGGILSYSGATTATDRGFTLSAGSGITLPNTGVTLTVQGLVTGSSILTVTGAGTTTPSSFALTDNNTGFTGGITLANGINYLVTASNQLGTGTKTLSNTNGTNSGTFVLDPGAGGSIDLPTTFSVTASSATTNNVFSSLSGNNIIRGNVTINTGGGGLELNVAAGSKLTLSGTITAGATARVINFKGNGDGEFSGVVSNGSTLGLPLTKVGTGTLTLSATNTFSGGTAVSAGTLKLGAAAGLGNNTAIEYVGVNDRATVASGATLDLNGQAGVRKVIQVAGTGVGGAGALLNNSANSASLDTTGALAGLFSSGTATGYSAVPTLTFTGGGGSNAAATAQLGVTVANFTIAGGTTVYSAAPTVTIGGGSGATATATLTGGVVSGITITNPGSGFTGSTTPTITFSGGTTTTVGTNPTGTGNTTNYQLVGATITNFGTGYTSAPTVTASGGGVTFTASPTVVQMTANTSIGGSGTLTVPIVSGAFALTKVGVGALNLTGASTYTGGTTVTGGSLNVTGSLATSSLTLNAGTNFSYLPATPNTLTLASGLTLGGSNTIGLAFGDTISSTPAASATGSVSLAVSGTFTSGTTYTLLSAASGLSGATYTLANPGNYTYTLNQSDTSVTLTPTTATALTTAFWKGGVSGVWSYSDGSTTSNWTTDAAGTANTPLVPSASTAVTFSATGAANQTGMTLGANMSIGSFTFNSTSPVQLLADGNTLTVATATGITLGGSSSTVSLAANLALGATQTWTNNSSSLFTAGPIATGGFTLTLAGPGNISLTGGVSGTGGLTKTGTNTATLTAPSTYTGSTTIAAGTVVSGVTNALPAASALVLGASATTGTLNLQNFDQTVSSLTVSSLSTTANTIIVGSGNTLTVNGNVLIGPIPTAANQSSKLTIAGGGNLVVATAAAGTFLVGGNNVASSSFSEAASLDLTGLATAVINTSVTGTVRVNNTQATLLAGNTATLLLPTPTVPAGAAVTTITAGTLAIGDSSGNAGGANQINSVVLGTGLTTLKVDAVNIGTGNRDVGSLTFAAGNGTVNLRAAAGTGRAAFSLGGTGGATGTSNGTGVTAMLADFTGHSADLLISTLTVGNQARTATENYNFKFDTGTLDATGIVIANDTTTTANVPPLAGTTLTSTVSLSGGATTIGTSGVNIGTVSAARAGSTSTATGVSIVGNFNVSGGTVTIGTTGTYSVLLGNYTSTNTFTSATDTFNISGGTVTVAGPIIAQSSTRTTSALNLTGGTLNMAGKTIGTAALPITASFQAGTLDSLAELNGVYNGSSNPTTLTKTGSGILTITGTNAYSAATSVTAGNLVLDGTLSATASLTVNNNAFLTGIGGTSNAAAINIMSGGTLSPGHNNPGVMTFGGAVSLAAGSSYVAEIGGTTATNSSTNSYDQANATGLTIDPASTLTVKSVNNFSFSDVNGATTPKLLFILTQSAAGTTPAGQFSGLAEGAMFTFADGSETAQITYKADSLANAGAGSLTGGNDVALYNLQAVPEPGMLSLTGLVALGMSIRRRRTM